VPEIDPEDLASSHTVKRLLSSFYHFSYFAFRRLLQRLFTWRLSVEQPDVIVLGLDMMVMHNGDAKERQGVKPNYRWGGSAPPAQLGQVNRPALPETSFCERMVS